MYHAIETGSSANNQVGPDKNKKKEDLAHADIRINLFVIGFTSSAVQLLLIREMMNIAGGYELMAGIFLASWLLNSALGAALAGKSNLRDIRKINIIFSIAPILSLMLLLFLSEIFLDIGETPSLLISVIYTFIVLLPFCLVSGFTFVKLINIAKTNCDYQPGTSFGIETAGGVAAGIFVSLLISEVFNTWSLLLLIIILTIAYSLSAHKETRGKTNLILKVIFTLLAASIIVFNPDKFFRQILLPGIVVTSSEDSPYGNITEGKYNGEKSVYYNHRLLTYKNDVIEREENIHYAMLQSPSPETVVLISGSLKNHLPEIIKYPVSKITYIELDPALAKSEISAKLSFSGDINIENSDAFRYIRSTKQSADVIILLVPPPSTLLLNRYYTSEFFSDIKERLNPNGIFICSPGPGDTYFNKESINLYSSVFNSLSASFKNIEAVVGNKLYFVASDSSLSVKFCDLVKIKNIDNYYVNSDYLSDDIIGRRSKEVKLLLDDQIRRNSAEYPVACFHFMSYNFSKNTNEKGLVLFLIAVIFAIPFMVIKRRNLVMFFTASALAGFEIIILLTLQLIIGNMYQLTGLVIAGLMTGLAAGAGIEIRFLNRLSIALKCLIILLFYLFTGLLYTHILDLNRDLIVYIMIILSSLIPALLTGNIFRELTKKAEGIKAPGSIYSADLAGSAFGFIFISGFAVPALGIKVSIFVLSALIITGFLFGTIRNKQ